MKKSKTLFFSLLLVTFVAFGLIVESVDSAHVEGVFLVSEESERITNAHTTVRSQNGISLIPISAEASVVVNDGEDNDVGIFEVTFLVEALDDDYDIPFHGALLNADRETISAGHTRAAGVYFTIESSGGAITTSGASATLSSKARINPGGPGFVLREGRPEEFTLEVIYTPEQDGIYQLQLEQMNYGDVAPYIAIFGSEDAIPFDDFETNSVFLN